MESGPLSTAEFKEFGKKVVLFLHVTSQVASDKDQNLLQEKGGRGFPYLIWMNEKGDKLMDVSGRAVEAFNSVAEKLIAWNTLKKKAAEGDDEAKKDLFVTEVEMGVIDAAAAKAKMEELKLSDEQKKRVAGVLCNSEAQTILQGVRNDEQFTDAGRTFIKWRKDGKWPTDERVLTTVWQGVMKAAEADGDPESFEAGLNWLDERYGKDPNNKRAFDNWKATLDKLKKAAAEKEEGSGR